MEPKHVGAGGCVGFESSGVSDDEQWLCEAQGKCLSVFRFVTWPVGISNATPRGRRTIAFRLRAARDRIDGLSKTAILSRYQAALHVNALLVDRRPKPVDDSAILTEGGPGEGTIPTHREQLVVQFSEQLPEFGRGPAVELGG